MSRKNNIEVTIAGGPTPTVPTIIPTAVPRGKRDTSIPAVATPAPDELPEDDTQVDVEAPEPKRKNGRK